jgi:radical SAM protein with 4Fe4S-binding SPASM domain
MPMRVSGMSLRKRLNLLAAGMNLLYRRARPWAWPIRLQIEPVNYCVLHCPVCPTGSGRLQRPRQAMEFELFQALMAEVGPYLLTVTLWAWGEPLLHPRFADMVRLVREYGAVPLLSTNGQNLSDGDIIEALLDEPPTYLIIALDGLTDETCSLNRPGARVGPAIEGVRRLAEMKRERDQGLPLLHMRYIVTRHNQHEVERVREFATAHQFGFLTMRSLVVIDGEEGEHRSRVPDLEQFRAYEYRAGERVRRERYACHHAFLYPAVFADGTVVPCDQDYNATQALGRFGSDGSFRDIWFGKRAAAIRKTIRDSREEFSFCRNCPFADRPEGSASVSALDLRGDGVGGRHAGGFGA